MGMRAGLILIFPRIVQPLDALVDVELKAADLTEQLLELLRPLPERSVKAVFG